MNIGREIVQFGRAVIGRPELPNVRADIERSGDSHTGARYLRPPGSVMPNALIVSGRLRV